MANQSHSHSMQLTPQKRTPSPAIVAQEAVRRLPRWALLSLCALYVMAGFLGREPWKSEDLAGFGTLFDVLGTTSNAWLLARCLAAALLSLTLAATWYGTYYLARRDAAQPVPFAFGGEAKPTDYARAIADGALLAFIACLGLAQLSHETTPALVQMMLLSFIFFALASYRYHTATSIVIGLMATTGLAYLFSQSLKIELAGYLHPSQWRRSLHLLIWFAWPVWALAIVALVKWRRHWLCTKPSSHICIPLCIVALHLVLLPAIAQQDRWFLSALPALACLAAFALPTLKRNLKSLIDLFTLFFFSGCAIIIWVVWIAMETRIPPQPAANIARLAPLFTPSYSAIVVLLGLAITVAWGWLVVWRLGKHRPAIWMSMVLPASGAVLCWFLLMSLWMPLLDHARSYKPLMAMIQTTIEQNPNPATAAVALNHQCIQHHGLDRAQRAAIRYYLDLPLVDANRGMDCQWLFVDGSAASSLPEYVTPSNWQLIQTLRRPTDDNEDWFIYQRKTTTR